MTKREIVDEQYPGLVVFDGFDDAIVGVVDAMNGPSVCYDRVKCLRILIDRDGMDDEGAVEWLEYNMAGLALGDKSPVFIDPLDVAG